MSENTQTAVLEVGGMIRSSSTNVAEAHENGVEGTTPTGDNEPTAHRIGAPLGIDIVTADVLPEDKSAKIAEQEAGKTVAMVGDGVNAAPALAPAALGFAISAGTDVAIETAELPGGEPA